MKKSQLILLIVSFLLSSNAIGMELRRSHSAKLKEIHIINTTGKELKVIFDKGILPISLYSRPLPAHTPEEIINKQNQSPLIKPDGYLERIPEDLRTHFNYGVFISKNNVLQTLPLDKLNLYDTRRSKNEQRLCMYQDFSAAQKFSVITKESPQIKSVQIDIINNTTYCIALDTSNPKNPKIIVEPTE